MPRTTRSNSLECSIQTLHTDLECSTAQYTFKRVSAGLKRHIKEPKNEEKMLTALMVLCLL